MNTEVKCMPKSPGFSVQNVEPRLLMSGTAHNPTTDLPDAAGLSLAGEATQQLGEVGIGLTGVHTYDPTFVFGNAMLQAKDQGWFSLQTGRALPLSSLDQDGNIVAFPRGGVEAQLFVDNRFPEPSGRYVLEFTGSGTVEVHSGGRLVPASTSREGNVTRVAYDLDGARIGNGGVQVRILDSSTGDPVRDVRFWMPDPDDAGRSLAPSDQAGLRNPWTSALHPDYVADLQSGPDYSNVRFMDWTRTNRNSQQSWSDRRLPTAVFGTGENYRVDGFDFTVPGGNGETFGTGVAWEHVIDAANTLGTDAWINVPHAADNNYVENLAKLFRFGSDADGNVYDRSVRNPYHAPLDPGLNVYVELSNEIWANGFNFRQGDWAQQQAQAQGIKKETFNGRRFAEIWAIFDNVFAEESQRVLKPAATFTAVPFYTRGFLDAASERAQQLGGEGPDFVAVTTYFGQPLVDYLFNETDWRDVTAEELADPDNPLVNNALDHLLNEMVLNGGTIFGESGDAFGGVGEDNTALAAEYGLPLIGYEGNASIYTEGRGWGVTNYGDPDRARIVDQGTPGSTFEFSLANYAAEAYGRIAGPDGSQQDRLTQTVNAINRHPRFADAYRANLLMGLDLGVLQQQAFIDVGAWTKYGQWGLREYQGQDAGYGPGQAVKLQTLADYQQEAARLTPASAGGVGLVPDFGDNKQALGSVAAGGRVDVRIRSQRGGDGLTRLTLEEGLVPEGLTVTRLSDGTLRVSGTVDPDTASGDYRWLVSASDRDGDTDWAVFSLNVFAGNGNLINPGGLTGATPVGTNPVGPLRPGATKLIGLDTTGFAAGRERELSGVRSGVAVQVEGGMGLSPANKIKDSFVLNGVDRNNLRGAAEAGDYLRIRVRNLGDTPLALDRLELALAGQDATAATYTVRSNQTGGRDLATGRTAGRGEATGIDLRAAGLDPLEAGEQIEFRLFLHSAVNRYLAYGLMPQAGQDAVSVWGTRDVSTAPPASSPDAVPAARPPRGLTRDVQITAEGSGVRKGDTRLELEVNPEAAALGLATSDLRFGRGLGDRSLLDLKFGSDGVLGNSLDEALASSDYLTFEVDIPDSAVLDLDELDLRLYSQNQARGFAVFTSATGFDAEDAVLTGTASRASSSHRVDLGLRGLTEDLELRVYGYGGGNRWESFGLGRSQTDDLTLTGTLRA